MKILIAPNGFKESMTALQAAQAISRGLSKVTNKHSISLLPLADGGSGTVEAIVSAVGGEIKSARVLGPRGNSLTTAYGLIDGGKTAVIEIAAASGLALLRPEERNPMLTSSFGTGQLISRALQQGVQRIIIGLGDSATIDAGTGALKALGVRLLDGKRRVVNEGSTDLVRIRFIDLEQMHPKLKNIELIFAVDVDNALLGEEGAAHTFGPQKGASSTMVRLIDEGLAQWAKVVQEHTGQNPANIPGSGAAGGFATGFLAFCGAKIVSGSDLIFEMINLKKHVVDADLIITGEGSLDEQTLRGKTPARLAEMAHKAGIPLIAFAGQVRLSHQQLIDHGFKAAIPIVDQPLSLADARLNGEILLERAAERTLRLLLLGKELYKK